MNSQQLLYYKNSLNELKEKQDFTIRMSTNEVHSEEEIKNNVDDLALSLKKVGINNIADLKKYINQNQEITKNVTNIASDQNPQHAGMVADPGLFGTIMHWASNVMLSSLGGMIGSLFSSSWFKAAVSFIWNVLKISAVTVGLAAVIYLFAKIFIKIYGRIVNKAKKVKKSFQEVITREEISEVFDIAALLKETENPTFILEATNPEKQAQLLDLLIKTTQDALDLLGAFAVSASIWLALTSTLTPLMIVGITGSILWVTLLFARNIMRRTANASQSRQNRNITQINTDPTLTTA